MKRIYLVPALLVLAACANDQYLDASGKTLQSKQSNSKMVSVLHDCKMAAIHHHMQEGVSPVIAGAVAGAMGGLLVGIANTDDPNVYIQDCMAKHGYSGTSQN